MMCGTPFFLVCVCVDQKEKEMGFSSQSVTKTDFLGFVVFLLRMRGGAVVFLGGLLLCGKTNLGLCEWFFEDVSFIPV